MDVIVRLIIEIIAGAVGGNAAGAWVNKLSLGTAWNSILGAIGGVILGQLLHNLGIGHGAVVTAAGVSGLDVGAILTQLVGGGLGGGVLTLIAGLLRNTMRKPA
jgi:hypothetical protein